MSRKKIEVPISEDVGLHMEFLEGETETVPPVPEPMPEPPTPIPLIEKANCILCLLGPPERRALEECDIALRRGNADHCTKFVRKV